MDHSTEAACRGLHMSKKVVIGMSKPKIYYCSFSYYGDFPNEGSNDLSA